MSYRLFTKRYESFLEKLAMGTTGVKKALEVLRVQGHDPMPVEKGTMSFKVWTSFKIKRFRVPDLVCLKCGRRFEVRSKTKPEISMSHSQADPEREWDYGLNDEDYIVFVICQKQGSEPVKWRALEPLYFISVKDMREKEKDAYLSIPKGREEGFERRLIWPSKFALRDGVVLDVNKDSVKLRFDNGRKRKISLDYKLKNERTVKLKPLVKVGDRVVKNQAIASIVNITEQVPCNKDVGVDYYIKLLTSSSRVDRFIAAKALRRFNSDSAREALKRKLQDPSEEKLILYEVAASLMELNDENGKAYINSVIEKEDPYQIHEVIISLCDVTPSKSFPIIKNILGNTTLSESVRATAAWALGELGLQEAFDVLVKTFDSMDVEVKKEAARALLQLCRKIQRPISNKIFEEFKLSSSERREGLSWVIGKMLKDEKETYFRGILDLVIDEESKIWVSYILGIQDPEAFKGKEELIRKKDEKLYFAANVLWVILRSWIWGLEEY